MVKLGFNGQMHKVGFQKESYVLVKILDKRIELKTIWLEQQRQKIKKSKENKN